MNANSRRKFFQDAAILGVGLFGSGAAMAESAKGAALETQTNPSTAFANRPHHAQPAHEHESAPAPGPPVITPDVPGLGYELDGLVKVFRLTAEPVHRKIAPFKTIDPWGYNGSCPGPTIQVNQNDRVRVIFENRLPESTTLHWHCWNMSPRSRETADCSSWLAGDRLTFSKLARGSIGYFIEIARSF